MSTKLPIATNSPSALVRLAPLIPLVLCLLLGWITWNISHTRWITEIEKPEVGNRASQLQRLIQDIKPGERIPITRFRTEMGKDLVISVMEGTFDRNAGLEQPSDAWRSAPWSNAILVNSVDENQRVSGGMSGNVIIGCMTGDAATKLPKLVAGSVFFHRCTENLRDEFRIKRVANVAVVTWKDYSENPPCYDPTQEGEKEKYYACIEKMVATGLASTLKGIREMQNDPPDAIIIPALGTGVGALPKNVFYRVLHSLVQTNLKDFPTAELVMHVWRKDPGHSVTSFNLSSSIAELETTWRQRPAPRADLLIILAGIFGGLFVATAWAQFMGRLRSFSSTPYVAGWAAAAFGAATGVQKLLIEPLGTNIPYLTHASALFAVGVAGVLICGPLMRAGAAYKALNS